MMFVGVLDVVEVAGMCLVAVGVWLLSPAWGLIVAGALLIAYAALKDTR